MLSGTGLSVPVGGGRLLLGTWQGSTCGSTVRRRIGVVSS
jgi:thiamine phosphate synthase YjbQ (UPF0047 family)